MAVKFKRVSNRVSALGSGAMAFDTHLRHRFLFVQRAQQLRRCWRCVHPPRSRPALRDAVMSTCSADGLR